MLLKDYSPGDEKKDWKTLCMSTPDKDKYVGPARVRRLSKTDRRKENVAAIIKDSKVTLNAAETADLTKFFTDPHPIAD